MMRPQRILQANAVTREATAFPKRLAGRRPRPRILRWRRAR